MDAKVIQVGNSKGIRLPRRLLLKYGFGDKVTLRETEDGVLIEKSDGKQLSWKETYQAMAESDEDWTDWAELDAEDMG
ncbi:MAG: AbrB/MazE/SpoVT family DNA-binding domain-containing protein [Deltaproteobacteria bacterium]|nr:AbrB/MazE/SpoVT family DNA-binding domain-containing protein [Deltaproteobacteria bacterium]MBN2671118.1 AbrB/MazE/SpoVT family DNA-binding domain-containing protein [Deltaproteobacteria bacterium]